MRVWGLLFLACTLYLALGKTEADTPEDALRYGAAATTSQELMSPTSSGQRMRSSSQNAQTAPLSQQPEGLRQLYSRIWRIVRLPPVLQLIGVLFTAKLAFVAADNLTVLKLTERGFPKESMAMMVFFMFPFELLFPVLIGKWIARSGNAMALWSQGYPLRMVMTLVSLLVVWSFPVITDAASQLTLSFYLRILLVQIAYSFTVNILFVSQCAFFATISDADIGGSYMTLLNTVANLGGTWPKAIVFFATDALTCNATKELKAQDGSITQVPVDCAWLPANTDGYYIVSIICFGTGCVWYAIMRQKVIAMGRTSKHQWSCK